MTDQIKKSGNNDYHRGVRYVLLLTLWLNLAVVAGKLTAGLLDI